MTQALLLTGAPGTGKTTIIRQAISTANVRAGGFYTQEIRQNGVRVGFEIITLDGSQAVLAHIDIHGPHKVSRYGVDVATFDKVAVASLRRAIRQSDIVVVDEIGKMELFSYAFKDIILETLNGGRRMLGTIMLQSNPFADRIKRDTRVQVLLLSRTNRQHVLDEVIKWLQS